MDKTLGGKMIMGKMEYHVLVIATTGRSNGKWAWRTSNETIESREVVDGKLQDINLIGMDSHPGPFLDPRLKT